MILQPGEAGRSGGVGHGQDHAVDRVRQQLSDRIGLMGPLVVAEQRHDHVTRLVRPRRDAFQAFSNTGLSRVGSTTPRVRLRLVRRVRAVALGQSPRASAQARTRSRVSRATICGELNTRDGGDRHSGLGGNVLPIGSQAG